MNAYHLPYSSLFIGCIILICVRFFLIVCLNYQQGVTRCCISYRQMRRGYKSKFTDKSKANLIWIHLELAKVHRLKGLTSPYIVSYLRFLNLNNILALPQTFVFAEAGLLRHDLCLLCFLPARFTRMRASLRNQNKCKPSTLNSESITESLLNQLKFNCPKACLKVNKLQSPKAPCFSLL